MHMQYFHTAEWKESQDVIPTDGLSKAEAK